MTLEQILTEEDKASILNEVERERRRVLVMRMYEEGMKKKILVNGIAESLGALGEELTILRNVDYELIGWLTELYEKGIEDERIEVRINIPRVLCVLAEKDVDKYVELYLKVINNISYHDEFRCNTVETLFSLAAVNPQKLAELYEETIKHEELASRLKHNEAVLRTFATISPTRFRELYDNISLCLENKGILRVLGEISPQRVIDLFERGMKDNKVGTRMGATQVLSILSELDSTKFIQYTEEVIKNDEILNLFSYNKYDANNYDTIMGALLLEMVNLSSNKFIEVYQYILRTNNARLMGASAEALGVLAEKDSNKFVELYKQTINNTKISDHAKDAIATSLSRLVERDIGKYLELYRKGLGNNHERIRSSVASTLSALSSVDQDKFVELYIAGAQSNDLFIRVGTSKALEKLASIDLDKYVEMYKLGIEDENSFVKRNAVHSLIELTHINPQLYVKYLEEAIRHKDKEVKGNAIVLLETLTFYDPELYVKLCEYCLEKDNTTPATWQMRYRLGSLAIIDPNKYVEIFKKALSDDGSGQLDSIAHTFGRFVSTIMEDTLTPILDEEYEFIIKYMNSKYIKTSGGNFKQKEDIERELKDLVKEKSDYTKLKRLLEEGKAKDLNEMIECSKLKKTEIIALCRISSGGFKQVYKAILEEKGFSPEDVALKIYDLSKINNKRTAINRLLETIDIDELRRREVRLSRRLRHDNLTGTLDVGNLEDGRFYIAEELVNGCDLEQFVGRVVHDYWKHYHERYDEFSKKGLGAFGLMRLHDDFGSQMLVKLPQINNVEHYFSPEENKGLVMSLIDFALIYYQVVLGLRYLHKKGFIHRDLKNDNVIVSNDLETVKITDLQTVIHISELGEKTKGIHGSYNYAAPELLLGENPSFASDVYSLGVMMYYSLTGELPFGHFNSLDNRMECVKDVKLYKSKQKSAISKIPKRYKKIIYGCLELYPQKRIRTGELYEKFNELVVIARNNLL